MTAAEAFTQFASRALSTSKAKRFASLASSEKGQHKILEVLCHKFEEAVLETVIQRRNRGLPRNRPCFAFHTSCGFGATFQTFEAAYDALSIADGWLILDIDGSIGVFRPEARWDDEILIKP